jgi:hypothetical protein
MEEESRGGEGVAVKGDGLQNWWWRVSSRVDTDKLRLVNKQSESD